MGCLYVLHFFRAPIRLNQTVNNMDKKKSSFNNYHAPSLPYHPTRISTFKIINTKAKEQKTIKQVLTVPVVFRRVDDAENKNPQKNLRWSKTKTKSHTPTLSFHYPAVRQLNARFALPLFSRSARQTHRARVERKAARVVPLARILLD